MKKIILLLILLLLLPAVFALTADLSPDDVYETNTANFTITVDNFLGPDVINDIVLDTDEIEVISVQDFIGWQYDTDSNLIHWFNGTIENNVASALFVFSSTLPKVNTDQDMELDGTVTYADSSTEDFTLNLEIQNDNTPPVINSYIPQDYVRANEDEQEVIVEANDPQTGVKEITYEYGSCSGNTTTITLTCLDGSCTGTADFSGFDEGDTACFTITATNNADETETLDGTLEFDGTVPEVTLNSPTDGSFAGPGSTFSFTATDNTANTLDCVASIDDEEIYSATVLNGVEEQFALNATSITEAMHNWEVTCTDAVGLSDTAITQFSYDQTPPVITLNSPADGSLIGSTVIDVNVTDNIAVDSVVYNLPIDTSSWTEGLNIFNVTATDKANNVATASFTFYVDRTAPTISILGPANASTFDYNAIFTVNVQDTYDTELNCTLMTSATDSITDLVPEGVDTEISLQVPLGDFTWSLTCVDDAGNSATTSTYYGTAIDISGPIIDLEDVRYVVRGKDLEINAAITDISGVDGASASFEGATTDLTASGDDYAGSFAVESNASLGTYSYTVYSQDANSYSSNASDEFEVIEGYVISITMPNQVSPGQTVSLSGNIKRDDDAVPSGNVTIEYHETAEAEIDAFGDFDHDFTAPNALGTYSVKISYETDNYIYAVEKTYRVVSGSGNSATGGGGGSSNGYDLNIEPYEYVSPPVQEGADGTGGQNLIEEEEPAAPVVEEQPPVFVEEIPPEDPRTPIGAGQASGLFSMLGGPVSWFVLLLALAGICVGLYFSFRRPKSKGKINWDGYFD